MADSSFDVVAKVDRGGDQVLVGRRDADASGGDPVTGYLYVSTDFPWPADPGADLRPVLFEMLRSVTRSLATTVASAVGW